MNSTDLTQPQLDTTVYKWAAVTLRAGMLLSIPALLLGLAWLLLSGTPLHQGDTRIMQPGQIASELAAGNPLALLNLGLLLLLLTPGTALLVQLLAFALSRNWRFACIAALLGAIILLSISISEGWLRLL